MDIVEDLKAWADRDTAMSEFGPDEHIAGIAADEIERLRAEVSNLSLANKEARKTIDRLNELIPRDACDTPQTVRER